MNKELAAEFLALAERLHDLALRIEAEANAEEEAAWSEIDKCLNEMIGAT